MKLVITDASCNRGWCRWFAVQDVGYGNGGHSFFAASCSKLCQVLVRSTKISKLKGYCMSSYHYRADMELRILTRKCDQFCSN